MKIQKNTTTVVVMFSLFLCSISLCLFFLRRTNPHVVHDDEVRLAAKFGFEQEIPLSVQHEKAALKEDPKDNLTKMMLATDLLKMGETENAVTLFKQVVASKDILSPGAQEVLKDIEKHGNTVSLLDKIKVYRAALQANTRDDQTRYQMATLLSSVGKKHEAAREFEKVIAQQGPFAVAAKNALTAMKQE